MVTRHEVREFVVTLPVADALADDMGNESLLSLAEADARDRLAEVMFGRAFTVLGVRQQRVALLPGHRLGGFDPDTGEPLGPEGFTIVTRVRVASPDWPNVPQ